MREHGVVLCGMLSEHQCKELIDFGRNTPFAQGRINADDGSRLHAMRQVDVWPVDSIKDTLFEFAQEANRTLQYDIEGLVEPPQLLRYPVGSKGYGWHTDLGYNMAAKRKLSIVAGLNDSYNGGLLQFFITKVESVRLKRGMVVAFPSWLSHQVTQVTKTDRWTLAAWVSGPELR